MTERPDLRDPRILEWPLQCGVTVIAAHCGTKSAPFETQYFDVFAEMLDRYPRLYGDISAFNVPIRGRVVPRCLQPPVRDRLRRVTSRSARRSTLAAAPGDRRGKSGPPASDARSAGAWR